MYAIVFTKVEGDADGHEVLGFSETLEEAQTMILDIAIAKVETISGKLGGRSAFSVPDTAGAYLVPIESRVAIDIHLIKFTKVPEGWLFGSTYVTDDCPVGRLRVAPIVEPLHPRSHTATFVPPAAGPAPADRGLVDARNAHAALVLPQNNKCVFMPELMERLDQIRGDADDDDSLVEI